MKKWSAMAALMMFVAAIAACGGTDVPYPQQEQQGDVGNNNDGNTGDQCPPGSECVRSGGDNFNCSTDRRRSPDFAELGADGIDNDCDQLIDAQDPSCADCAAICGVDVQCNSPPAPECLADGNTLRSSNPNGVCTPTAQCIYEDVFTPCARGCITDPDGPDYCAECAVDQDCLRFPGQCMENVCNAGRCESVQVQNGTSCNTDGDLCTQDACQAGVCQAGAPVDCSNLDDACNVGECSPDTGECAATPRADNTPCEDGVFCNGTETCQAGSCQAGAPVTCTDGLNCTLDACSPDTDRCEFLAQNGFCTNGQFCDGEESCNPDADPGFNPSGCEPGLPPVLDDGIDCTDDACDEVEDEVTHTANDVFCNNGLFCDGAEVCDMDVGGCIADNPVNVDDGIACTRDSCDEGNDIIVNAPDNTACDDGAFCNGEETCDGVIGCVPGTPVDVDDGTACTLDECDEVDDRVVNTPDNTVCDNGLSCDGQEECDHDLGCVPGTPVDVDDGTACTTDTCEEGVGPVHTPVNAACDNGQACDGSEECDLDLGCVAGSPMDCSALDDECVAGVCNPEKQECEAQPFVDNTPCEDDLFCTVSDRCLSGMCAGLPRNCTDAGDGVCVVGVCDEPNDVCVARNAQNGAGCSDNNACTNGDTCQDGVCQPSEDVECASPFETCDPDTGACAAVPCDPALNTPDNTDHPECAVLRPAWSTWVEDNLPQPEQSPDHFPLVCHPSDHLCVPVENADGECPPDGDPCDATAGETWCTNGVIGDPFNPIDTDGDGVPDEACPVGGYCAEATDGKCHLLADCALPGECQNPGCANTDPCGGATGCTEDVDCASGLCQDATCVPPGTGGAGILLPNGHPDITVTYFVGAGGAECVGQVVLAQQEAGTATVEYKNRCPEGGDETAFVVRAVVSMPGALAPCATWALINGRCLDKDVQTWSGVCVGDTIVCASERPAP